MIAIIKNPTTDKLREARQRLVQRNVLPVKIGPFLQRDFQHITEVPEFVGFLGLINRQKSRDMFDEDSSVSKIILESGDYLWRSDIRLTPTDAVEGAIIWGANPNPSQVVEIE